MEIHQEMASWWEKLMRVNTNSWHYKLIRYTSGEDIPEHLCPYARLLLFSVLLGGWLQYLYDHINIDFQMPHWGIERAIKVFMRHNKWLFKLEVIYSLLSMIGVYHLLKGDIEMGIFNLALTTGLYVFAKTSGRGIKFFEGKSQKFKTISEKSIVLQSVKSNHNKICPKLDFIDNKIVEFNEKVSMIKEPQMPEKQSIKNKPEEKIRNESKAD